MTRQYLNINNAAVVKHTARLEKMHRSALPVAIRGSLNNAAFDVKSRTMPKTSTQSFTVRQSNFFKANSRVEMAKGFDVRTMTAIVGFTETKLRGGNNKAIADLVAQEYGGSIGGRSFIPMDPARVGSNTTRPVQVKYRLSELKNVVNAQKVIAPSKKQKFVRAAFAAQKKYGRDAYVLGNVQPGGRITLSKIQSIKSTGRTSVSLKRIPVYTYKKGFVAKVKPSKFMRRASMESGLNIEHYFIHQAQKQIERLNK